MCVGVFFFSSRRRHTRLQGDWSSDVCSSDLAVKAGDMREDLYYRLRVVPIHVPPLRERPEDIPLLAEYFLSTYWVRHRSKGEAFPKLSDGAMRSLCAYPWRGNVRELQNVIEHVAVLAEPSSTIRPEELPLTAEA